MRTKQEIHMHTVYEENGTFKGTDFVYEAMEIYANERISEQLDKINNSIYDAIASMDKEIETMASPVREGNYYYLGRTSGLRAGLGYLREIEAIAKSIPIIEKK